MSGYETEILTSIKMKHLIVGMLLVLGISATTPEHCHANNGNSTDERPNVIVIMTDDQGIGDFGCMGNPLIETPNLDAMFERSAYFSRFYVHPVCAPTRACLMTGRYNYRTRVVDTYLGRAMMEPTEVTIAEQLKRAGYATGIFGKWHLGDCYPMRPMDQGFDESVVHRGGGIGQSSDPPGAQAAYTNPILFHNGQPQRDRGYCSDIYFDFGIEFIQRCKQSEKPFFLYLADNCPHGPFKDVPKDWWERYKEADLSNEAFPVIESGDPLKKQTENVDLNRRVFAMVSNIDENVGRLQTALKEMELIDNTIVIFLTDNGPNSRRYVNGLRGMKTSVYEGGIKTLCMLQWPAKIKAKKQVDQLAAHIDLAPTILKACGVDPFADGEPKLDGIDLWPAVDDDPQTNIENGRQLFIQTHRGNVPQRFHHCAVIGEKWKVVNHSGFGKETLEGEPAFELFDLTNDPYEQTNLAASHPEIVKRMADAYENWFDDVSTTREDNYAAPPIVIDPSREFELVLTQQDSRREPKDKGWGKELYWHVKTNEELNSVIACRFSKKHMARIAGPIELRVGEEFYTTTIEPETNFIRFEDISLPTGTFQIRVTAGTKDGRTVAAYQAYISSRPVLTK